MFRTCPAAAALQAPLLSYPNLLENVIRDKTGREKKIPLDHKIFQIYILKF